MKTINDAWTNPDTNVSSVNVNTADRAALSNIFRPASQETALLIDSIIRRRNYSDFDDLHMKLMFMMGTERAMILAEQMLLARASKLTF